MKNKKIIYSLIMAIFIIITAFTFSACKDEVGIKEKQITSITVTGINENSELNQDLDLTNAKINITYDDNSNESINLKQEYISNFDKSLSGKQTITITYKGLTYNFDIIVSQSDISIEKTDISIANFKNLKNFYKWKREKIKTEFGVSIMGNVLIKNTDYDVSFSNNIEINENAQITITGKNNYTGSKNYRFSIVKRVIDVSDVQFEDNLVYNANAQLPVLINNGNLYNFANEPKTNADNYYTEIVLADPVHYRWSQSEQFFVHWK